MGLAPGGDRERLTGAGVYYVVRTLGWRVGLHCWPHGLRHASITAALRGAVDQGIPLPEVLTARPEARSATTTLTSPQWEGGLGLSGVDSWLTLSSVQRSSALRSLALGRKRGRLKRA